MLSYYPAVAENQPANKNRMNKELSDFAARLRGRFFVGDDVRSLKIPESRTETIDLSQSEPPHVGSYEENFNSLALELFTLQFQHNTAYRKICIGRKLTPEVVEHWAQIPAVPTSLFKELELSCIPPAERTAVFHSSGTTEQKPSRHFHCAESLAVYEASLWPWFARHALPEFGVRSSEFGVLILTPTPEQAPHSSLVHMFETVRQKLGGSSVPASRNDFLGKTAADGSWTLDFGAVVAALSSQPSSPAPRAVFLLATAFSFVHLLDFLAENKQSFQLAPGSLVMETGGYKNRSRCLPKTELHELITARLGVPSENIICEYGMSELSSQAYDSGLSRRSATGRDPVGVQALACSRGTLKREHQHAGGTPALPRPATRHFRFPPWARVQIISPETGREVAEGETGLVRIFDLANVFSVMAVQTEDLGIRRGDGFELIGRAALAEARGCSLMTVGETVL